MAFVCVDSYWPLVISETIVFHSNLLSFVDPLPSLVLKECLSHDELLDCQKIIYNLVDMETKNTPLPIPGGVIPMGKQTQMYVQIGV